MVEDIQKAGKKSADSLAIADHVEPEPDEVPVQAMEDVDEGHPEISGNADVPEEIVSLEQVTLSKNHEYISFMKPFSLCKKNFVFVLSSNMLFFVTCALSTCTFALTSALTDYNVSQLVQTQLKPHTSDVDCYGRMMCPYLRSQQADLAVRVEVHKQNPQWPNSVHQKRLVCLNLLKFLRR